MLQILIVPETELTPTQWAAIHKLEKECFSNVPEQDAEEDFIAEGFARVFACEDDEIVGMLGLKKRNITFAGTHIVLGGIGGVCVSESARGKGVATQMLQKALTVLDEEQCDIACLNVDLEKQAYKLYERLGFTFMERPISFENIHGEIKHDTGTMFIPIRSKALYDLVMHSQETFHYGKGYW